MYAFAVVACHQSTPQQGIIGFPLDVRGCLLGRGDYGPFYTIDMHHQREAAKADAGGRSPNQRQPSASATAVVSAPATLPSTALLACVPVFHPRMDVDERLAVAALLCALSGCGVDGRAALSHAHAVVLDALAGLQRLAAEFNLTSPPRVEDVTFALSSGDNGGGCVYVCDVQ